jgi:hypothetical protein
MTETGRVYPQFPLYVILRTVDYDEATELLSLTPHTPFITVTLGVTECFPTFTSESQAEDFIRLSSIVGRIVACDARKLLYILHNARTDIILIDRDFHGVTGAGYPTPGVLAWLYAEIATQPFPIDFPIYAITERYDDFVDSCQIVVPEDKTLSICPLFYDKGLAAGFIPGLGDGDWEVTEFTSVDPLIDFLIRLPLEEIDEFWIADLLDDRRTLFWVLKQTQAGFFDRLRAQRFPG